MHETLREASLVYVTLVMVLSPLSAQVEAPGARREVARHAQRKRDATRMELNNTLAGAVQPSPLFPMGSTMATGVGVDRPFSLAAVGRRKPPYLVKSRPGSGLIVISALQHQLTHQEQEAISRFRLEQFLNAGFYDEKAVERYHLNGDPAMEELAPEDYHAIVANTAGEIICYMCLQSPLHESLDLTRHTQFDARLGALGRPMFPVELEFGADLYGRHPGLSALPISAIREISSLVRNMTLTRSVTTDIALVETIVAAALYVIDVRSHVEAVIGCIAPEARRVLYNLGVPMTYAPYAQARALPYAAPITDPQTGERVNGMVIWADAAYEPGRFWPFALASVDLRLDEGYFTQLDAHLGADTPDAIWRALSGTRRERPHRASRYLIAPEQEEGAVYWTREVSSERVAREQRRQAAQ